MNPKTLELQVLEDLQKLFEDKNNWTWGTAARDTHGRITNTNNPTATCWCLVGGIDKCAGRYVDSIDARERVAVRIHNVMKVKTYDQYDNREPYEINDDPVLGLPAVRRLITETIEELEGEAA